MAKNGLAKAMRSNVLLKAELLAKDRKYDLLLKKYQNECIDSLTKLPGRKLLERMHRFLVGINKRRYVSGPKPITLAVIDVDNLKVVNDTHGHLVGDAMLCDVVRVLENGKRPEDVLIRWGGDELVILLTDILDEKAAYAFIDRIRYMVSTTCFLPKRKNVTISAGVCVDIEGDLSTNELFQKADKNLYKAKNSGRNCVISSET